MDADLFCNANAGKSGYSAALCHALSACPPTVLLHAELARTVGDQVTGSV